ncbi:hypothetical protein QN277_026558 [Acacia crassicarpa]|uniref:Uncharacterized protein n=1 Tax=Acacia crassicarpa TaxID=499986 RepID=A0AAE1J7V9_9FABA|nr:hypothetical protein QN277_026558 [Acacia crassicarpa]
MCGRVKREASYVYDLEENLHSLEEKSEKLEDMKKDVETLAVEEETTREMQRSHQVSGWLNRVQGIQQVSHHPPMSAGHAENKHFTYDVTSKLKT